MKKWWIVAWCLAALLAARPVAAQEMGEEEAPERDMAKMVRAAGEFVKDTRINEADIMKLAEVMPSFDKLGDDDEDELEKVMYKDGEVHFEAVLTHEKYVAWCKEHGVESKRFLRVVIRGQFIRMRDQVIEQLQSSREQLESFVKEMEAEGADSSQMKANLTQLDEMIAAWKAFPQASDEEKALFEKHEKELKKAFGDEDEEDEGKEDDDGEDEDED